MWHCPNCGEPIDDVFDACWKCGTGPDGTAPAGSQAEPSGSDVRASAPEGEPAGPNAGHSGADPADASSDRIVALCDAPDPIAANALCDLLERAGIRCRIVGEPLGSAAGGLPLGETLVPRIWVREGDAARACEIIDEEKKMRPPAKLRDARKKRAPGRRERARRVRWASRSLAVVGGVCIAVGAVWAWCAWTTMRRYAATTEGVAVSYQERFSTISPRQPEFPLPRQYPTFSHWYEVEYAFDVGGTTYYSVAPDCQEVVAQIPIHYDPRDPAQNVVGPLTPPWSVLEVALGIGGSLLFAGYCVARLGRRADRGVR